MRRILLIFGSIMIFTGSLFAQVDPVIIGGKESGDLLKEGSLIERQRAILNILGKKVQSVELLLAAIEDPDPTVRYYAAQGLSQSEKPSQYPLIIEKLLKHMNDENLWVRAQLIDALREITFKQRLEGLGSDERVLKAFLFYAKDSDPYIRASATQGLVVFGKDPVAKQALLEAIEDPVWLVRQHSSGLPKGYYGKIERQYLIEALRDEDYRIRLDAVYSLRNYRDDPHFVDHLIERLYDPDGQVVAETIVSLGLLKDSKAVKPLLELLEKRASWKPDVSDAIFNITGRSLEEVSKGFQPGLNKDTLKVAAVKQVDVHKQIEQFKDGNQSNRVSAILRLTWSDKPEAVETLLKALKDENPRVRYAAADAIANYLTPSRRNNTAVDSLFESADDSNHFVRMKKLETLSFFTFEEHKTRVLKFFNEIASKEEDPFIQQFIFKVIRERGRNEESS